jgi:hypothetical protein
MKTIKNLAAVLLILALVLGIVRASWTFGKGVDSVKEFVAQFFGQEYVPPVEGSYSNTDGFIEETRLLPVRGVEHISLAASAATVKLLRGEGSDIIVQAAYNESNFSVGNEFLAKDNDGSVLVSLKLKESGKIFTTKVRPSTLTVTIPEKFKGTLSLDFNAVTLDGDVGNAAKIDMKTNAGKTELRGIAGDLNANINVTDSVFVVRMPSAALQFKANVASVTVQLPRESNYVINRNTNVGTLDTKAYDAAVQRKGKEAALTITGNVSQFTIAVAAD